MRLLHLSFVIVALGTASACTTSDMQAYTPVKQKTAHSEDTLRHAARQALEAQDYVAVSTDERPSVLETREKEVFVSSVPRLAYRYSFRVDTKGGQLSIDSTCKHNSAMAREAFEDCGSERPQRVLDEQEKLRAAILERANKRR
jgi:hypothetical protein